MIRMIMSVLNFIGDSRPKKYEKYNNKKCPTWVILLLCFAIYRWMDATVELYNLRHTPPAITSTKGKN